MAVQYDASAIDMIRMLGCSKPAAGELWEVQMPALQDQFLRLEADQP